jgi:PITH domain
MVLQSDADEQLLLHIPFRAPVKLTGVEFTAPKGGTCRGGCEGRGVGGKNDGGTWSVAESRPTKVSLYVNKSALDFSDAEDITPDVVLAIKDDAETAHDGPKRFALPGHKLRTVEAVDLWVQNDSGSEVTRLGSVRFFGRPSGGIADLTQLGKKPEGEE